MGLLPILTWSSLFIITFCQKFRNHSSLFLFLFLELVVFFRILGKHRTRLSSSLSGSPMSDFIEQNLLVSTLAETYNFTDKDIARMKSDELFSEGMVFRLFDSRLRSDHVSKIWVCFLRILFLSDFPIPFLFSLHGSLRLWSELCSDDANVWMVLFMRNKLVTSHNLQFNVYDLASVYKLRNYDSSRIIF